MSQFITKLITLIHERTGNVGLAILLIIVLINLYTFWWVYPRKIQAGKSTNSLKVDNSQSAWQRILKVNRVIFSIIFGIGVGGIIVAAEPALWLKIFSGFVFLALLVSLLASLWVLIYSPFE